MKTAFPFTLAAAMLVAAGFAGPAAEAKDPTAEALVKRIPRLSSKNRELKSFHARLSMGTGPISVPVEFAWHRPDRFGLLWMHSRSGCPVVYVAEKQGFVSNVIDSTIFQFETAHLNGILKIDGNQVKYRFGIVQKKSIAELDIDLPSLFGIGTVDSVKRIDDRHCRLTRMASSGRSKLVAVFRKDADWTLEEVRLIQLKDNATLIAVSDIRINQPFPKRFHSFPQLSKLPKSVTVKSAITDSKLKNVASVALMMRAMAGQIAFADKKARKSFVFIGVDWKEVERNVRIVTPALRQLLNLPSKGTGTATAPNAAVEKTATKPPAVRR